MTGDSRQEDSSLTEQKMKWAYEDRQVAIRQSATNKRLEEMARVKHETGVSYGQQQYAKYREHCRQERERKKREAEKKREKEEKKCQE